MTENPFAKKKKKNFKKWKNSKRNLPNELNEGKKLNINAKAFVPKRKALLNNGNNHYYPQYINTMNNANNYSGQAYFPKNYYFSLNNNYDFQMQYNKELQLDYMRRGLEYNNYQNSQTNPFLKTNIISEQAKEVNNRANPLKVANSSFMFKSMRENLNKLSEDVIYGLNTEPLLYSPQNVALTKKVEEIRKMKEKEEDQKEEENKDKTNDKNSNEQKKKSKLFKLLESMEDKSQKNSQI